ncbi:hypothetical protein Pmani_011836 [Petrolisthes manimaculis]|uniref:Uncharacterized protein n=1 Tax=Petrolisthes manimaculis TaxID=1843537 RepID=A0AAE1Q0A4_9EUCA|nr:hypothetical protein Pmani_011836 [Petrolisthes manimaculis]
MRQGRVQSLFQGTNLDESTEVTVTVTQSLAAWQDLSCATQYTPLRRRRDREFDKRLGKLDEVQEALEVEVPEEELDDFLDEAHAFRQASVQHRIQAEDRIRELAAAAAAPGTGVKAGSVSGQSSSRDSDVTNVKLPKLELPKFNGEVTQWQSFWDQFFSHIDATDLPVISKFTYLMSLLEGDAKNVVKGLAHTCANYSVACGLLKERYNKPERIIFAHVQALLNGQVNISIGGNYVTTFCLPNEMRLEWARDGDGHERDLEFLLKFLDKEISRLERSEAFKGKKFSNKEKKAENKGPKERVCSAAALHTSFKQEHFMCSFCGRKHKSENCYVVLELSGKERGQGGNCTVLQTAKVQVCRSDGTFTTALIMFDNGADTSYGSSSFVRKCKPQWITSAPMPYSSFGGHSAGRNELFQELWKLGLSWDEEMPSELKSKFQGWLSSGQSFKKFHISRCYFRHKPWEKLNNVKVHGFGDASEKGFGACVYLRVPMENNSYKVSLVTSKSRVAPIKTITLPRLELMGSLLCSRLVNFVKNTLSLDDNRVMCWTDSTIVLSWIGGGARRKDVLNIL